MRIGFVAGSYTARSTAAADEECINFFAETIESQGSVAPAKAYGGSTAQSLKSYYGTPGIALFTTLAGSPVQGICLAKSVNRLFGVSGAQLTEIASNGALTVRGAVSNDGTAVSFAWSSVQMLIVSGGFCYCFTFATNVLTDVTSLLAGVPVKAVYSDGYFVVCFKNSNKFQISAILDGTTWPGIQVNAVSVFPDNITSIEVNHRELWVFGQQHAQPYQDTGSLEIFDVIPGTMLETGNGPAFSPCKLDNSIFWISEDERGARMAFRSQGYTPTRISTHAVETDLASYSSISGLTSYSYQDGGHLFWVLYIPGAQWNWVFDVGESLWHKRAKWVGNIWQSHWGWNHVYAFGKHLIGDWASGKIYEMNISYLDDAGTPLRRLRRAPTVIDEMERMYHAELTVDFDTGQGPQPPLLDGSGSPRPPQAMLRWSDNRGKTWSNEHVQGCGMAGQYNTRVIWRRLGQSRYRVYELSVSDPIPWAITDAYLRLGQ